MPKRRERVQVLLVDEQVVFRQGVRAFLEEAGVEVLGEAGSAAATWFRHGRV